ncbi:MAG: hypothetical protein HZC55_23060 [Verrucomicrobia bacterium]|nr:hypothetical protein [Verrucomicrobiota bacterium]
MSWYSNDPHIDFNELVPVFARINRCRNIEDLNLRLDAQFECRYSHPAAKLPLLELSQNLHHVDLFKKENLNITVICGINGVGKTTILKLLSGRLPNGKVENDFLIVFGDGKNNYLANRRMMVNRDGSVAVKLDQSPPWWDLSLNGFCANRVLDGDEDFSIWRNITAHYALNPRLYDDGETKLFTHLSVEFWNFEDQASDLARDLNDKLGWNVSGMDIEKFLKEHPAFAAFLYISGDNSFDRLFSGIKRTGKTKDIAALHSLLGGFDPNGNIEKQIKKLIGLPNPSPRRAKSSQAVLKRILADAQPKAYPIADCFKIRDTLDRLTDQLDNAIKRFLRRAGRKMPQRGFHIHDGGLRRILFLRAFKKTRDGRRYLDHLSSGEFMDVKNKYVLHPCMMQRDSCWIYQDEPDLSLHPEWKRQYIARLVHSAEVTRKFLIRADKKYKNKTYSIVLTTHSPFLLSDVTADQAILLALDSRRKTIRRPSPTGTFAGNIGAMFYDQFFMTETIGMHAEATLNAAVKRIERSSPLTGNERAHFTKLFSAVGDQLLRKLLLKKLEETRS